MTTISIGDFEITALLDGVDHSGPPLIGYDPDDAKQICESAGVPFVEGTLPLAIHAFVVSGPGVLMVIDTGSFDEFSSGNVGFFAREFTRAGFDPMDVTHVVLTHLHIDHVGHLCTADGGAVFGGAELVISAAEYAFTHDDAIYAAGPEMLQRSIARGRRVLAPYGDRTRKIDGAGMIAPGIEMVPMPGHTVGHSGVMVAGRLLIVGDVLHQPVLQAARPDWACVFDADKDLARATRRAILARAADQGIVLGGMHLDPPGFARVQRAGNAYAITPIRTAD